MAAFQAEVSNIIQQEHRNNPKGYSAAALDRIRADLCDTLQQYPALMPADATPQWVLNMKRKLFPQGRWHDMRALLALPSAHLPGWNEAIV